MTSNLASFVRVFNQEPVDPAEIDSLYVFRRVDGTTLEGLLEKEIQEQIHEKIVLVGGRGSGKSSLSNYIATDLVIGKDVLPILVSRSKAPQSAAEILHDMLASFRELLRDQRIMYGGSMDPRKLLKDSQSTVSLVENLRELVVHSNVGRRILLIVDECDKGSSETAAAVLLNLQDELGKISSDINLLVAVSPVTYDKYFDAGLRNQFYRIDIPRIDSRTISRMIAKRISSVLTGQGKVGTRDLIDDDALELIKKLSLGIIRRAVYLVSSSLLVAIADGNKRVSRSVVLKAWEYDVKKATNFYANAPTKQRDVLEAIRAKKWGKALENAKVLSYLTHGPGYVVETEQESDPLMLCPEMVQAIDSFDAIEKRPISKSEVQAIRRTRKYLYVGQVLRDGSAFAIDVANLTKGTLILGGQGSGKTVQLKAILEEAALLGTNVLAFDVKGDLTEMAFPAQRKDLLNLDRWGLDAADVADFASRSKVVVHRPGINLALDPFPPPTGPPGPTGSYVYLEGVSDSFVNLLKVSAKDARWVKPYLMLMLKYAKDNPSYASLEKFAELVVNPPLKIPGMQGGMFETKRMITPSIRGRLERSLTVLLAGPSRNLFQRGDSYTQLVRLGKKSTASEVHAIRLAELSQEQMNLVMAWVLQLFAVSMKNIEGDENHPRLLVCLDEFWRAKGVSSLLKEVEDILRLGRFKGLGCLIATHDQDDIPANWNELLQTRFDPAGVKHQFVWSYGANSTRIQSRWLLTRHQKKVTGADLKRLGASNR